MKSLHFIVVAIVFAFMAGCSSPAEEAATADAEMKDKRMQLADQYQDCTQKANAYAAAVKAGTGNDVASEDQMTMDQCEVILKTLEALK
jgi:outer membrane biogenesis lipoprotein LolB